MMPSVCVVICEGAYSSLGAFSEEEVYQKCMKVSKSKGHRVDGQEIRMLVVDESDTVDNLESLMAQEFTDVISNHAENVLMDSDYDEEDEDSEEPTEDEDGDPLNEFLPAHLTVFIIGTPSYLAHISELIAQTSHETYVFQFNATKQKWID